MDSPLCVCVRACVHARAPGGVMTTFLDGDARTWYLASNPKISDYVQLRTPKYQGSLNHYPQNINNNEPGLILM